MSIRNMLEVILKGGRFEQKGGNFIVKNGPAKISSYLLEQYQHCGKLTFTIPLKRHELAEI